MPIGPTILFFVKFPVTGNVKSRLAASLGADAAFALYRNFVLDMLASIEASGMPLRVCYHPPEAGAAVRRWLGSSREYLPQEGADVGERMENAFSQAFAGGCPRAILVGSDIPDLPPAVFTNALRALDDHDAVIGPAQDGGYYLIGFRSDTFLPGAFRGIAWSTASVFPRTLQVLEGAGRKVLRLPLWRDVDTLDDLRDLAARSLGTAFGRSRTMTFLNEHTIDILHPEVRDATI
ncbi:MAG: TIGR04282 family arsenosugar biosynthesis glycosyltransferase [Nitrospirota bacterium]